MEPQISHFLHRALQSLQPHSGILENLYYQKRPLPVTLYQAGVAVDYYWEGEEDLLFQEEALVGPQSTLLELGPWCQGKDQYGGVEDQWVLGVKAGEEVQLLNPRSELADLDLLELHWLVEVPEFTEKN